jgi:hypothetical protein
MFLRVTTGPGSSAPKFGTVPAGTPADHRQAPGPYTALRDLPAGFLLPEGTRAGVDECSSRRAWISDPAGVATQCDSSPAWRDRSLGEQWFAQSPEIKYPCIFNWFVGLISQRCCF